MRRRLVKKLMARVRELEREVEGLRASAEHPTVAFLEDFRGFKKGAEIAFRPGLNLMDRERR